MSVIDVQKDMTACTMTIRSEWAAPIARVWQLWADPRKLERWWGPPTYPATVVQHDLRPGGTVTYFMTGPEGEQYHGWWDVVDVRHLERLEMIDGFADADGNRNHDLPTSQFTVSFDEAPGAVTSMVICTTFPSTQAMQQLIEMGMEEGMLHAMSQIDAILAD